MKKTTKNLALTLSTLRQLTKWELADAQGGLSGSNNCSTSCDQNCGTYTRHVSCNCETQQYTVCDSQCYC